MTIFTPSRPLWTPSAPAAPLFTRKANLWRRTVKAQPQDPITRAISEMSGTRHLSPIVVMFMGRRGMGKSLVLASTAKAVYDWYAARGMSHPIFANFRLDFAQCDPDLVEYLLSFPPETRRSYVAIDEIQSAFPRRRSLAGVNVEFSNLLTQIRKLGIEMGFTTQFPVVLDYQVTLQIDLFIRCETIARDHTNAPTAVKLYIHDWWGQWTGKDWRKSWPPQPGEEDDVQIMEGTEAVARLYNTGEPIPPLWSKNRDQILAQYWEQDPDAATAEDAHLAEVAAIAEATVPKRVETFEDMLASQQGAFNLRAFLDMGKRVYPDEIKAMTDLVRFVESLGYRVSKRGGVMMAEREG